MTSATDKKTFATNNPNRIPEEDTSGFSRWLLPEIGAQTKIIPAEKKPEPAARAKANTAKNQPQAPGKSGQKIGAEEIIEDVDADGMTMQPMTVEHLQAITEAAEKEGFDKGYQEGLAKGISDGKDRGYKEGQAQAQREMQQALSVQVQQLQKIADQLQQPIKDQEDHLHLMLVDFVCALTRKLVRRELEIDPGDVLAVVRQGVDALPVGAANLRLYLNPDDLALVETYAEEQHLDWHFIGDAKLLPGGCRIETKESLVDFSVETRLEKLLEQFLNKQLANTQADPDQNPTPDAGILAQRSDESELSPIEITDDVTAAGVSAITAPSLTDTAAEDFADDPLAVAESDAVEASEEIDGHEVTGNTESVEESGLVDDDIATVTGKKTDQGDVTS